LCVESEWYLIKYICGWLNTRYEYIYLLFPFLLKKQLFTFSKRKTVSKESIISSVQLVTMLKCNFTRCNYQMSYAQNEYLTHAKKSRALIAFYREYSIVIYSTCVFLYHRVQQARMTPEYWHITVHFILNLAHQIWFHFNLWVTWLNNASDQIFWDMKVHFNVKTKWTSCKYIFDWFLFKYIENQVL
jgi:hypothetical protein